MVRNAEKGDKGGLFIQFSFSFRHRHEQRTVERPRGPACKDGRVSCGRNSCRLAKARWRRESALTDAGLVKSGFGGEQIDSDLLGPGLPIPIRASRTLVPLCGSPGIHEPKRLGYGVKVVLRQQPSSFRTTRLYFDKIPFHGQLVSTSIARLGWFDSSDGVREPRYHRLCTRG